MKLKLSFFALILLAITSCHLSYFPGKSQQAIDKSEQALQATTNLYDDIIGSTDKSYTSFQPAYDSVNRQLTDLLVLDSSRKNTGRILIIARDVQKQFKTYEAEHKSAGKINSTQASVYKDYMYGIFQPLINAEKHYK